MPQDRAALIPVLHNIATQLRVDSIRVDDGRGERTSDDLCVGGGPDRGVVLRRDALRSQASAASVERSVRALEGARGADPVCGLGGRRLHRPRRPAESPQARLGSRRTSDAAAAIRRRCHRIAGPGSGRWPGLGAQRAPDRVRLSNLCAARRRRDGRRISVGSGRSSLHSGRSTTLSASPTSIGWARAGRRCGSTISTRLPGGGARSAGTRCVIDGHDLNAILDALARGARDQGSPDDDPGQDVQGLRRLVPAGQGRVARQGVEGRRRDEPRHRGARQDAQRRAGRCDREAPRRDSPAAGRAAGTDAATLDAPSYKPGDLVASREAYGTALARLGKADSRVVALDADVGNSTFSERFEKMAPERFYESYIAEQVMVGAAMGLAARGAIPFPSTFACFLTRAYDFLRMAAISNLNIKLAGSHAGVSIGEDGPSQMALEDLAMTRAEPNFTVLYPSDAVCAERCVELAAYQPGPVYIRTSRPKTPDPLRRERSVHRRRIQGAAPVGARHGDRRRRRSYVVRGIESFDLLAKDGVAIRVIDRVFGAAGRRRDARRGRTRDRRAGDHGGGSLRRRRDRRRGRHGHCAGRVHGPPPGGPRDSAQREARRAPRSVRHFRRRHRRRGQVGREGSNDRGVAGLKPRRHNAR